MKVTPIKSSPRDVFLYLLTIITLYVSLWRLIELWFQYINTLLPDNLSGLMVPGDMRFSIAALIVVFPVYIGLTWFLRKDVIAHPEKRNLRVRKWLLNFTLFLAALTIIVDLITLINNFLNGELTMRFLLKVIAVFLVAGAVFGYYFWDLRRATLPGSKPSRLLAATVSLVIFGSIVGGFFIIGSPNTQRNIRLDNERVTHLQILQSGIINYWSLKNQLPAKLDDLKNNILLSIPSRDPVTSKQYEYRVTGELSFELCAVFSREHASGSSIEYRAKSSYFPPPSMPYMPPPNNNWQHTEGRFCFPYTIDKNLYKMKGNAVPSPYSF